MQAVNAILDIGKTHIKLSLFDDAGHELVERRCENGVLDTGDYKAFDVEAIWQWFLENAAELSQEYELARIMTCTHGATAALIGEGMDDEALVFPVTDYEDIRVESLNTHYPKPPFTETFSPDLPAGLNLGRSIYWLSQKYPQEFARVTQILMYPQYWGWRLTGCAVSEVTSLGCHTDLWAPLEGDYSSLVKTMHWQALFPEQLAAGTLLGTIRPELAEQWGINPRCQVFNGIHDSNASLVPYLKSVERPASVISSGTWFVIFNLADELDASRIQADKDMLLNTSFEGRPIPSIRFMGGREWEIINPGKSSEGDLTDVQTLMDRQVFALPPFSNAGGPFAHRLGCIDSEETLSLREKSALASLYLALMTDYCLDQFANSGDIYIGGPSTANALFLQLLAELRPGARVFVSDDNTGTSAGVLALMGISGDASGVYRQVANVDARLGDGLLDYRDQWRARLDRP